MVIMNVSFPCGQWKEAFVGGTGLGQMCLSNHLLLAVSCGWQSHVSYTSFSPTSLTIPRTQLSPGEFSF
jgi:hypothetical protein